VEILSGDQHSSVAGNNVEEVVDLLLVVHGNLRLALVASVIQTKRKSINDMKSNLKDGLLRVIWTERKIYGAAKDFTFKTTELRYSKLLKTLKKAHTGTKNRY
jgi:hypothetical protein